MCGTPVRYCTALQSACVCTYVCVWEGGWGVDNVKHTQNDREASYFNFMTVLIAELARFSGEKGLQNIMCVTCFLHVISDHTIKIYYKLLERKATNLFRTLFSSYFYMVHIYVPTFRPSLGLA